MLDLNKSHFAQMLRKNINEHSVYKLDQQFASSDYESFNVLLQELMLSLWYSQTWFRVKGKGRILLSC